jgi:putative addiction module component (TIGR02574 family)
MSVKEIPNFERMTDLERLQLAEDLIASIRDPDALPEPLAHRLELERRWLEFEREPGTALSEDQFWNRAQDRRG